MFDGVEFGEASEHDDGARFSIVAGPATEASKDPGCKGESASGVRIFLFFGFALEVLTNLFEDRLISGIEGVAERTAKRSVSLGYKLHHGDCSNHNCGDKL